MDGPAPRRLAPRPRLRALVAALALLSAGAGLAACSDEEDPIATPEEYREAAVRQCDRHMTPLLGAWDRLRSAPFSDAELAAFYRSELVPRVRSILRSLRADGLPPDEAVHTAINDAAAALQQIEDDAAGLIDRRRNGNFLEDENPWVNLNAALRTAGVDCAVEANDWVP